MHFGIFGSVDESGFGPDWTDEEVVVLFGGADLDLTRRVPGPDAALTIFTLFGGARVVVPPGSQISAGGISIFGGRRVRVQPGEGPAIRMTLSSCFGGIEVVEAEPEAVAPAG